MSNEILPSRNAISWQKYIEEENTQQENIK